MQCSLLLRYSLQLRAASILVRVEAVGMEKIHGWSGKRLNTLLQWWIRYWNDHSWLGFFYLNISALRREILTTVLLNRMPHRIVCSFLPGIIVVVVHLHLHWDDQSDSLPSASFPFVGCKWPYYQHKTSEKVILTDVESHNWTITPHTTYPLLIFISSAINRYFSETNWHCKWFRKGKV